MMGWTRNQQITLVVVVVFLITVPVLWQISSVRAAQATTEPAEMMETVSTQQTPNDYDGDSIPDATDQCPQRPETENGFQDDDGCPDVVETTGAS
jgi:hypothetical protein